MSPAYGRPSILEQRINAGEKIEGITGYVPAETKCCSGGSKVYIPIRVIGVKLEDCTFAIHVVSRLSEVLSVKEQFTISSTNFFENEKEIEFYEDYLRRVKAYKKACSPFEYSTSTRTRRRQMFVKALEETTEALRTEIHEEFREDGGVGKISTDKMGEWYVRMMKEKFFPRADEDFDPEGYENFRDPDDLE
jgi:hypothetical protein